MHAHRRCRAARRHGHRLPDRGAGTVTIASGNDKPKVAGVVVPDSEGPRGFAFVSYTAKD